MKHLLKASHLTTVGTFLTKHLMKASYESILRKHLVKTFHEIYSKEHLHKASYEALTIISIQ